MKSKIKKSFKALLFVFALNAIIYAGCQEKPVEPTTPPEVFTINTFNNVRHAFGQGLSQYSIETFNFNTDPTKVESIHMYVRLRCPAQGCNAWDMFANVKLEHPTTKEWLEIGRYITPYGVDNSQAGRGFKIDVTDFKSLLTGEVKLRSFVEVWGSDGWLVSIDFEVKNGNPEYKYHKVIPLLNYADNSLDGVPYGEVHSFELSNQVAIDPKAEHLSLRTIITGWGHATPSDPGGRRCAEWCFRTHEVFINGQKTFEHQMGPIGCSSNPVQPQNGNWAPDRAGWCPGMAVPVRHNTIASTPAGQQLDFEYRFENWTNDFQSTVDNKHAYYAISAFLIMKSNIQF